MTRRRTPGLHRAEPRLREQRRRQGRKIVVTPPLFPGYAFVLVVSAWWSVDEMGPQYRAEVSDSNEVVVTYDLMPIVKGGYNVCRTSAWDGKVTTLERGPVPLAKAKQIAADDDANS